jgi:hypothetical protein
MGYIMDLHFSKVFFKGTLTFWFGYKNRKNTSVARVHCSAVNRKHKSSHANPKT